MTEKHPKTTIDLSKEYISIDVAAGLIAACMEGTSLRKMADGDREFPDMRYWRGLVKQTMKRLYQAEWDCETLTYGKFAWVIDDLRRIDQEWLPKCSELDIPCDPPGTHPTAAHGWKIEDAYEGGHPFGLIVPDTDAEADAEDAKAQAEGSWRSGRREYPRSKRTGRRLTTKAIKAAFRKHDSP